MAVNVDKIAVLGGGSWGTALALLLARNNPRCRIHLWVHDPQLAASMREERLNQPYLAGFELPAAIAISNDLTETVSGASLIVGVMPSAHARQVYTAAFAPLHRIPPVVSATKGIEPGLLARMSQVIEEVARAHPSAPVPPGTSCPRIAVLSGPSFAREVARGDPVAIVVASRDRDLARHVQEMFSGTAFRVYVSEDVCGVEMGGALKNIIAIAAGICVGLNLGHSTVAALITRGAAEMTRLACALGAQPRTLSGLSGMGDLVLTATGALSRNRAVGIELGRGRPLAEILQSMRMVAEGVGTTGAALELARRAGVEMPITEQMYAVLNGGRAPREAIRELMQRRLKEE
ncbi:MAG TPA: NAD(P)H-dependent glycerol-3-phosphate dehydrogenase [Candidatus Dormibacteraeota bacterium]|nr:NAD(P)H-dependent glycerol-3-phosphate dehydrogenase [Candidatus Dormibacteraeota bacterium]